MKKNNLLTNIPAEDPDEIDLAMIAQIDSEPLCFESSLTLEEIEANFKNMNVVGKIIEALNEVLYNIRKQKEST